MGQKLIPTKLSFCKCKCGERVTRYRNRFINGHNRRKVLPFTVEVEAMLSGEKEVPFCRCGCGRRIEIKLFHKGWGIPKFIKGHHKRGWIPTKETREKLSKANIGKKMSKEFVRKNSERMRGDKNISKYPGVKKKQSIARILSWHNPEYVAKQRKARHLSPNKAEKFLIEMLRELFPGEYKFVGDLSFALAGKNPDFIHVSQKKIIEFFGDYWHGEGRTRIPNKQHEQERIDLFAKYGYQTLVIWGYELSDIESLVEKIKEFHNIGQEILV